jgi:hypothetical protein
VKACGGGTSRKLRVHGDVFTHWHGSTSFGGHHGQETHRETDLSSPVDLDFTVCALTMRCRGRRGPPSGRELRGSRGRYWGGSNGRPGGARSVGYGAAFYPVFEDASGVLGGANREAQLIAPQPTPGDRRGA